MKISVIVPVYNCKEYLIACIDSILAQTYRDLEILLIDDGSIDGSSDICDHYERNDQRVKVVHQINQGVSVARNTGIAISTGELVTFVDSDDALEADMYEILVHLLTEHKADVAHCGYRKMFFDGTSKAVLGTGELIIQDGLEACESIVSGKHFTGSPWNKLYRRALFENVRFDSGLKINEDVLFNIEVLKNAKKTVFYDIPKYLYFEREHSVTRKTNMEKMLYDTVVASEKIFDVLKETCVEQASAERLYYALICLYRHYILENQKDTPKLKVVEKRLIEVKAFAGELSKRHVWNYRFMKFLPWLYVLIYRIYKKIRVANYDI